MIAGTHAVIYAKDTDADRAFFRDVQGAPAIEGRHLGPASRQWQARPLPAASSEPARPRGLWARGQFARPPVRS